MLRGHEIHGSRKFHFDQSIFYFLRINHFILTFVHLQQRLYCAKFTKFGTKIREIFKNVEVPGRPSKFCEFAARCEKKYPFFPLFFRWPFPSETHFLLKTRLENTKSSRRAKTNLEVCSKKCFFDLQN